MLSQNSRSRGLQIHGGGVEKLLDIPYDLLHMVKLADEQSQLVLNGP
jgi:hypothetical protein